MSLKDRITYAKLIKAHADMNKDEVVRLHFGEIGAKTKYNNEEIGYLFSAFWNDRNSDDVCKGMNIKSFIDWLEDKDPMVQQPEAFIMAGRMSVLLRGIGNAFGMKIRMSKLWEEQAIDFLRAHPDDENQTVKNDSEKTVTKKCCPLRGSSLLGDQSFPRFSPHSPHQKEHETKATTTKVQAKNLEVVTS